MFYNNKVWSILAAIAAILLQLSIIISNNNQVEATITYIEVKYPLKVS